MIEQFKQYCQNQGFKPYEYKVLAQFVESVKNGDLVACSVCGEYNHEEHMKRSRFDYDLDVCPDCERDGL